MYNFNINNIAMELKSKDKKEILKELFTYLDVSKIDNIEECFDAILCREVISSTGVGRRIAIPHAKTRAAKELQMVFGMSKNGINFDSIDFYDVKFIFMILSPMYSDEYLELINKITKFMRVVENQKNILAATSETEIYNILHKEIK